MLQLKCDTDIAWLSACNFFTCVCKPYMCMVCIKNVLWTFLMQRKWLFTKMFVWISRVSFILLFFCVCRQPWRGGKTPAHMGNQITVLLLESSQPNKVKTQPVQLTLSSLNSDINRCSISWSGNCRKALMRMFSGQINSTTDGVSSV